MYIWIGCKLPEEFEREIRTVCLEKNQEIGLDTVAFLLPQHISLKISFATEQTEEILDNLSQFFAAQMPFSVEIRKIEQAGDILWMTVGENPVLQQLHGRLDEHLKEQFGIGQHLFDTCFQFHSTLFIDRDVRKIGKMKTLLQNVELPRKLIVDTVLLGASETGKPGTYSIVRTIDLC